MAVIIKINSILLLTPDVIVINQAFTIVFLRLEVCFLPLEFTV